MMKKFCILSPVFFFLVVHQCHSFRNSAAQFFSRRQSGRIRRHAKGASKEEKASTKSKGFGGGFGSTTSNTRSNIGNRNAITEDAIHVKISKMPGLKESMTLEDEIYKWDKMSTIDQAMAPQRVSDVIQAKRDRLEQLRCEGWTQDKMRNALHEATWDATAEIRHQRHQTAEIPTEMKVHMLNVAKFVLEPSLSGSSQANTGRLICDVGCGTGILISFLAEYAKSTKVTDFKPESVHGVDLSAGMVSVAKRAHPEAVFQQIDFLQFQPAVKFSAVVMNECLHNFGDLSAAIRHAAEMLSDGGRLIVSHPKGFDNVVMQSSKNRLLVPNRLPTAAEFKTLADGQDLRVMLEPDIRSPHYIGVMSKDATSNA